MDGSIEGGRLPVKLHSNGLECERDNGVTDSRLYRAKCSPGQRQSGGEQADHQAMLAVQVLVSDGFL